MSNPVPPYSNQPGSNQPGNPSGNVPPSQQPSQQPVDDSLIGRLTAPFRGPNGGILVAGAVLISICLIGVCVVLAVVLLGRPRDTTIAANPNGVTAPTSIPGVVTLPTIDPVLIAQLTLTPGLPAGFVTPTPGLSTLVPGVVQLTPVLDLGATTVTDPCNGAGSRNPYEDLGLVNMTQIQMEVLGLTTNQYTNLGVITGTNVNPFKTATNIGVCLAGPLTNCPDHVRLTATLSNNATIQMGLCLDGVPYLRSPQLTTTGGADLQMGLYFNDVLRGYLPAELTNLLIFN